MTIEEKVIDDRIELIFSRYQKYICDNNRPDNQRELLRYVALNHYIPMLPDLPKMKKGPGLMIYSETRRRRYFDPRHQ